VLEENTFRAIPVQVGITNGMLTEITGGLKPGQKIITEFKMASEETAQENNGGNSPFMPRPRNRQQQQKK
jgi:HlyD family secretion protein